MKHIVIIYDALGTMVSPEVVLFTDKGDPLPYIKTKLKNYDIYNECFQVELDCLMDIEEAITLIEEYNIHSMQIHVVDNIDPEV